MAQHDYDIANGSGLSVRNDINDVLSAIRSLNSGPTAPTSTVAYQFWYDTTNAVLKMRNVANSDWVSIGSINSSVFDIVGNAASVTNGVYTTGNQTIGGTKTFSSSPIVPTASLNDNTTKAASTAFVVAQIADDAPTKTGTGASGTWGISITGNAATVTNGVYSTNFTGSNQSLGSNGYQKLPGGLILQWGSVTVNPAFNGTQAVTFPTAFSSAVYSVTATPISVTLQAGDKRDSFSVQSVSTTGFTLNSAFENITSLTYYWFAVGS